MEISGITLDQLKMVLETVTPIWQSEELQGSPQISFGRVTGATTLSDALVVKASGRRMSGKTDEREWVLAADGSVLVESGAR